MQVLYLGRAPRTKETLSDFREKCRVTRHSQVFHGLTGSQRTLRIWGVTLPVRRCTSLVVKGGYMSSTALILSRFASIPRRSTIKPKNFSTETPKAHLAGFNFIL